MNDRNIIASAVRGFAMVLVVYGHVLQRSMTPFGEDFFLNPGFKTVYAFHMPLFVFLSGYTMVYSLNRRGLSGVLKVKAKTLLVPFVSWSFLGVITFSLLRIIDEGSWSLKNIPSDLASEFVLQPTIWILITLFVSSGLLLGSIRLERRWGKTSFLLIYAIILAIPYNEYGALFYIQWLYPFYVAGYFVHKSGARITGRTVGLVLVCVCVLLFAWLLSFWGKGDYVYIHKMKSWMDGGFPGILRMGYRYAIAMLGIAVAFGITAFLLPERMRRVLDVVGIYSLDIYLIQRYLVEGLYPRFLSGVGVRWDYGSPFFLYLAAPAVTVAAVYVCMLISRAVIRKNGLLNALLLGNRN